jgi:Terminase small subunit
MSTNKLLTPKQRAFVSAWIENGGNTTQAALLAFECSTPASAASCASRMLRNRKVVVELEWALDRSILAEKIVRVINDGLNATLLPQGPYRHFPDHKTRLKTADKALKMMGAYKR